MDPHRCLYGAGFGGTQATYNRHSRCRRHTWAIAERHYGDGSKYQMIADASCISNPDLIHPGQALAIP